MGTFMGHMVPGLSLALLGLWHLVNTIRSYCSNGSSDIHPFSIKFWFPFPKCKHLELISIILFSLLSVLLLTIIDFPSIHFTFKPHNLEHASMFLHLSIFAGFSLFCDLTLCSDIFYGFIGILLSSVFAQEFFLLHFHSTDHVGLEGHYHFLLQLVVFVSFASALSSSFYPKSFSSALVLSVSVLFQGCWFLNMGFMLWVPRYVPKGCFSTKESSKNPDISTVHGAVACESLAAEIRAKALANLQFSWMLAAIWISTCALCLKLSSKARLPEKTQSSKYERLCRKGNDCNSPAVEAIVVSPDQRSVNVL